MAKFSFSIWRGQYAIGSNLITGALRNSELPWRTRWGQRGENRLMKSMKGTPLPWRWQAWEKSREIMWKTSWSKIGLLAHSSKNGCRRVSQHCKHKEQNHFGVDSFKNKLSKKCRPAKILILVLWSFKHSSKSNPSKPLSFKTEVTHMNDQPLSLWTFVIVMIGNQRNGHSRRTLRNSSRISTDQIPQSFLGIIFCLFIFNSLNSWPILWLPIP